MKNLLAILAFILLLAPTTAQNVEFVDDEECGCELKYVDGIQTTSENGLFGFRLADGTQIAPNIYRYVDEFHGDYCKVYLDDNQCGMIDRNGNTIVPCLYAGLEYPSCGRILAVRDGLAGFLDMHGNEVIPFTYRMASSFSENCACIFVPIDSFFSACTFIDTLGRQLFEPVYQNIRPFNEGYALIRRYDRWGMMDHNGQEVLPPQYEVMTSNVNGYFFAGDADGWALFDYQFMPLTDYVYTDATPMSDNRIGVKRNGKYGFLDPTGREVIPCIYDETGIFSMGRTLARLGEHYGIIDTLGNIILPFEYEDKTPKGIKYMYYDSLAMVEKDGKIGFVDLDGKLAIPFYFEEGYPFSEGLACVKHNGMWGYITTTGEVFMPFIFQHASPYRWGRAEVVYMGNVSRVDRRGKCVKNCKGVIAWRNWKE